MVTRYKRSGTVGTRYQRSGMERTVLTVENKTVELQSITVCSIWRKNLMDGENLTDTQKR